MAFKRAFNAVSYCVALGCWLLRQPTGLSGSISPHQRVALSFLQPQLCIVQDFKTLCAGFGLGFELGFGSGWVCRDTGHSDRQTTNVQLQMCK